MTLETIRAFLGWAAVGNFVLLLLVWFLAFLMAHDAMHTMHRRWFDLPRQSFDAIHYAGMAGYKIGIWMLFLIPYLVLRFAF